MKFEKVKAGDLKKGDILRDPIRRGEHTLEVCDVSEMFNKASMMVKDGDNDQFRIMMSPTAAVLRVDTKERHAKRKEESSEKAPA